MVYHGYESTIEQHVEVKIDHGDTACHNLRQIQWKNGQCTTRKCLDDSPSKSGKLTKFNLFKYQWTRVQMLPHINRKKLLSNDPLPKLTASEVSTVVSHYFVQLKPRTSMICLQSKWLGSCVQLNTNPTLHVWITTAATMLRSEQTVASKWATDSKCS